MNQEKKLITIYQALPSQIKLIMQVKSLVWHPLSVNNCYQLLKVSHFETPKGQGYSIKDIQLAYKFLHTKGLLVEQNVCNPLIVHQVTKDAVNNSAMLSVIQHIPKQLPACDYGYPYAERIDRDFRLALYQGLPFEIKKHSMVQKLTSAEVATSLANISNTIVSDIPWIIAREPFVRDSLLEHVVYSMLYSFQYDESLISVVEEKAGEFSSLWDCLIVYYFLRNDLETLTALIVRVKESYQRYLIEAGLKLLNNEPVEAIALYHAAVQAYKKSHRKRKWFFSDMHGVFYIIALLVEGSDLSKQHAKEALAFMLKESSEEPYHLIFTILSQLLDFLSYQEPKISNLSCHTNLELVFVSALVSIISPDVLSKNLQALEQVFQIANDNGYVLMALMVAEVLALLTGEGDVYQEFIKQNGTGFLLHELLVVEPTWMRAIDRLSQLAQLPIAQGEDKRLIWHININEQFIRAVEQKKNKTGGWSKGRVLSDSYYYDYDEKLPYLNDQDRRVFLSLRQSYDHHLNINALRALEGHPYLFHSVDLMPIELKECQPALYIEDQQNNIVITMDALPLFEEVIFKQESVGCYLFYPVTETLRQLYGVITEDGLIAPKSAQEEVLKKLQSLSDMMLVHSSFEIDHSIPKQSANTTISVQLHPYEQGLAVGLVIKPADVSGPVLLPGRGLAVLFLKREGESIQLVRNLQQELSNEIFLKQQCPELLKHEPDETSGQIIIQSPQACLQLLYELKASTADIQVEWPKGEKMQIGRSVSFGQARLQIKQKNQWFEIEGSVQVDHDRVIEIKTLLAAMDEAEGRFIKLDDGKFVSLTEAFQQRLQKLKALAMTGDDELKVHQLGLGFLDDMLTDFSDVELDDAWYTTLKAINNQTSADTTLPESFCGELRNYQVEGYQWLCRLSHWGVGACLADDMGLGKTIQAIALLLKQASHGPSLVIAPTSVCYNWQKEIREFAPSLRVIFLYDVDRNHAIATAKANDVIISSYGLIQNLDAEVEHPEWQVLVVDEAQAIKNSRAKRTQAIFALSARFRLALTGTPIENHLGELWSLFRFLNPGLLSSERHFNSQYLMPIEQHQDEFARDALRGLVNPFILRRVKEEVLTELPPKTEQIIEVRLSEEERAFYEAARLRSLEVIHGLEQQPSGQRRIKILAEITRLRQACCHPLLLDQQSDIASSKLHYLERILNDLIENKHKALVFSQFVQFLTIARQWLDEKGIKYHYIDGSTPIKQREAAVAAFQAGELDLFLLSLKAGGVGLNLTQADYVVIMDPWWNPAVEDQAADRVYRIGQDKPVTIYRLITEDSIESQIINLHAKKRDLAAGILEGSEAAGHLSEDDLLQLIAKR